MPPISLMLLCCGIMLLVCLCTVPVEASSTKLRIRFPQRIDVVHRHHTLHQYASRFPYGAPLPPTQKRRRLPPPPARKASRPRRRRPAPAPAPYGLDYAGAYRSWARAPGRRRKRPKPPPPPPPLSLHGYQPDGRETYQDQELRRDPYPYQYPYHYQYHNQYHGKPAKRPSSHWEKYPPYYDEYGEQQEDYAEGAYSEYDGQKAARYPASSSRYRKRPRRPPPLYSDDDPDADDGYPSFSYPTRSRKKRPPHYYHPLYADEYASASGSGDDRMFASASAPAPATASPVVQTSWSEPQQLPASSYLPEHYWGRHDPHSSSSSSSSQLEDHWSHQYPNHRPAAEADHWSQQYSNHRTDGAGADSQSSGNWKGAEDRQWKPAKPAAAPEADTDADIGYGEGLEDADGTVY